MRFQVQNEALMELLGAFVQLDVYLQLLSTCYNSCSLIILDSLYCGFQVRNEALMEPMAAFVQLDVYLQHLSACYNSYLIL